MDELLIDAWGENRKGHNASWRETPHHYASAVWTADGLMTLWESTQPYKTREAALKAARTEAARLRAGGAPDPVLQARWEHPDRPAERQAQAA
jgi:hypothetical protein